MIEPVSFVLYCGGSPRALCFPGWVGKEWEWVGGEGMKIGEQLFITNSHSRIDNNSSHQFYTPHVSKLIGVTA